MALTSLRSSDLNPILFLFYPTLRIHPNSIGMASKKIVVILEGAKDWNSWIQTIRTTAVNEGVWDLIDLEKLSSLEGDTIYEAVANG